MEEKNTNATKRRNPVTWVPSVYFAMGLPFVVLNMVTVLMFKGLDISDAQIALWTSVIMLPWTLKPLWSPFLEMYRTKKFFVVLTQLLSGCLFGLVALALNLPSFFYNLYFAINKAERNSKYHITSADFKFDATKPEQAEGKREIYVLVVGETSRAMEWSLYGYERKTTPRMEALDGLVHFTDVVTQSNNTHKSVPIILSAASAENYGVLYDEKSIVTAFKEAGFRTLVIANQKLTTSMIGAFYREADTFIDMSAFNTGSTLISLHDAAILPYLKKELDKEDGNLFVVLHTYGSHFNYHERYPKEFRFYTPDKAEGIRASYKKELRNAYDNSIHYTDYVLGEIVDMLAKTNAPASMLYLSDHGEDIFDDSRARYLHASPIPTYYQLHIPYVIWFSKAYRESYPQKYLEAQAHETYPVSTNSVFHTMLDIAGVRTPVADSTFALTNRAFKVRDRMYLGDHDDPIPFWKVGLKKQDFEMMDKWDIAYDRN